MEADRCPRGCRARTVRSRSRCCRRWRRLADRAVGHAARRADHAGDAERPVHADAHAGEQQSEQDDRPQVNDQASANAGQRDDDRALEQPLGGHPLSQPRSPDAPDEHAAGDRRRGGRSRGRPEAASLAQQVRAPERQAELGAEEAHDDAERPVHRRPEPAALGLVRGQALGAEDVDVRGRARPRRRARATTTIHMPAAPAEDRRRPDARWPAGRAGPRTRRARWPR